MPEPVADCRACRSASNYPRLPAERIGAGYADLRVSGATTDTIAVTSRRVCGMVRLGVAGRLSSHVLSRPLGAAGRRKGVPRPSQADAERAAAGLVGVVEETRRRAEHGRWTWSTSSRSSDPPPVPAVRPSSARAT
ncbi:hypothetical protein [Streptomyces griseorubiginosus]|uniref:hypothetical protein n=1 Tax=Streptomyces griseorubiginosus TaxID=67304 RepID=UPI0036483BD2